MNGIFKFFILGFIPTLSCYPFDENKIQTGRENFIGKGTNEIATALLQVRNKKKKIFLINFSTEIYFFRCKVLLLLS